MSRVRNLVNLFQEMRGNLDKKKSFGVTGGKRNIPICSELKN